jgi:recombination protein RecA
MGDAHVGLQARLMSKALRVLTASVARSKTLVIFINQLRMKIGVLGNPETTSGGNALKFYASVRLDVRRIGALKDGDRIVGNRTRVKVVKNKCAAPFRETELDVIFGKGFARTHELCDLGIETGVLEKSGSWITFDSKPLGQGRDAATKTVAEQPALAATIADAIRAARRAPVAATPATAPSTSTVVAA